MTMVPVRETDKTKHIAKILLRTEAAQEEMCQFYRFGRHTRAFPGRLFFLLSHCAHLLFHLWLADEDDHAGVLSEYPRVQTLLHGVNFGSLRYADYVRRTRPAETFEEHLKSEPSWFKFWMKLLERLDESRVSHCQAFSEQILACVGQEGFLEERIPKKSKEALGHLVRTDEVGWMMFRSIGILEEAISATTVYLAGLDPKSHALEQILSLVCMLRRIRRAIVHETPAEGPYVMPTDRRWGLPSPWTRLRCRKTHGVLRVIPRRDRKGIICTFAWAKRSRQKSRSWQRKAPALAPTYEKELFQTWSYDTGAYLRDTKQRTGLGARWTIQKAEIGRLSVVARHMHYLLDRLVAYPAWDSLIQDVRRTVRLSSYDKTWTATEVPWTYIKTLDKLIDKLNFVSREAQVRGGKNPAEEVMAGLWPPTEGPKQRKEMRTPPEGASGHMGTDTESVRDGSATPHPALKTGRAAGDTPLKTTPVRTSAKTGSGDEPENVAPQEGLGEGPAVAPQREVARNRGKNAPSLKSQANTPTDPVGSKPGVDRALPLLVQRLLEQHCLPTGEAAYKPVHSKRLQLDLGWNRSKVQSAMRAIFGKKPFTTYRARCEDKTILRFLQELDNEQAVTAETGSRTGSLTSA